MSSVEKRRALQAALEEQRAVAEAAEARLAEARARVADLERQLAEAEITRPHQTPLSLSLAVQPAPETPGEKIALFRKLFAGREDVFPRMWVNKRNGKKGYALSGVNRGATL